MKPVSIILAIIGLFACETKPVEKKYCADCTVDTEDIVVLVDQIGWMVYLQEHKKYAIEVAHYNNPVVYIPCEIPAYFHPGEMQAVKFSGKTILDSYSDGSSVATTYHCIQIDTVFSTAGYVQ
jgi:hypothetical protein